MKLLIIIFNFIYSSYFLFLLLFSGGLILTLDVYHHYQINNTRDILISRIIGFLYILLGLFSFIINKIIISLGI
ncbi:hypothetical protein JCM16358_15590 [Halanaerocella petrolearia]